MRNPIKQKQSYRYREQKGGYKEGLGEEKKQETEIKRYKLPGAKQISHRYEMYSVENTITK